MYVVIVGHVDHGKSTIIGRLLADTGSLPEGKLDQVKALCKRTDKPFEYAFLLDALKDEQAQGITIDAARVFFKSALRDYVILDAPGHNEFLKNMITGAARAEAALLVIDAAEGVRENSRRHGTMLSMLGINQVAVIVNKMDLVGWKESAFDALTSEYADFLRRLGVTAACFVPASGRGGDNVATRSTHTPWYEGPTVLEALDRFTPATAPVDGPLRFPVQDVYKFTGQGDDRRIVAGTIVSGRISTGDEIIFLPSAKRGRVRSIERFSAPSREQAVAGEATGITLSEQVYVARGEIVTRAGDPPPAVSTRFAASVFWLGRSPLVKNRDYVLRICTGRQKMRVEEVQSVMDASSLATIQRDRVDRHEVADCVLSLKRPLAFDIAADVAESSRFVIIDDYEIRGGGIIRRALPESDERGRETKWETSAIPPERRVSRHGQRAAMLFVNADAKADERRAFAHELELALFESGRLVHVLGIAESGADDEEQISQLVAVARVMLDAGFILVVTAGDAVQNELASLLPSERTLSVTVEDREGAGERVLRQLVEQGIIDR